MSKPKTRESKKIAKKLKEYFKKKDANSTDIKQGSTKPS